MEDLLIVGSFRLYRNKPTTAGRAQPFVALSIIRLVTVGISIRSSVRAFRTGLS